MHNVEKGYLHREAAGGRRYMDRKGSEKPTLEILSRNVELENLKIHQL